MKKASVWGTVFVLALLFAAGNALAGVFDSVKSWITGETLALIVSAAAAFIAGLSGALYQKVANTMKEAGEFLNALGPALEDSRITREELAAIVREGREIFAVWK